MIMQGIFHDVWLPDHMVILNNCNAHFNLHIYLFSISGQMLRDLAPQNKHIHIFLVLMRELIIRWYFFPFEND